VVFSGWKPGYGKTIIVRHDDGLETRYGHASKTLVKPGDRVDEGAEIALLGNTGRSTGPHLHFEVRRDGRSVDPLPYIQRGQQLQVAQAL